VSLRHQIIKRGVSLSSIPVRLRRVLLKERWFREALSTSVVIVETGAKRFPPIVSKDVRPSEEAMPLYEELCARHMADCVDYWRGRELACVPGRPDTHPYHVSIGASVVRRPLPGRIRYKSRWTWKWPLWVFNTFDQQGLPLRALSHKVWEEDHPHLSVKVEPIYSQQHYPTPPCLQVGVEISGVIKWPNGLV